MDIREIENLSAEEMKARRAEIVEVARAAADVAERYVSARIDAKMRDEKLAEQGKTIALLQESAEEAKGKLAQMSVKIAELSKEVAAQFEKAEGFRNLSMRETARAERMAKTARVHAGAITEAARVLNQSIANSQVDAANEG